MPGRNPVPSQPRLDPSARRQLSDALIGIDRGILRPGWVTDTLGITRTTLAHYRSHGIPADRMDELLAAIRQAMGSESPPWFRRLEALVELAARKAGASDDEIEAAGH